MSLDHAKEILEQNTKIQWGIFGSIAVSNVFPPIVFLNQFLVGGNDPCDQDRRMGDWAPFELSPTQYDAVKNWWQQKYPEAKEDSLDAEDWDDWVSEMLDL